MLGNCEYFVEWKSARSFCRSAGARMCTIREVCDKDTQWDTCTCTLHLSLTVVRVCPRLQLLKDETRSSGCNLDVYPVWSGTPCTMEDGSSGYSVTYGSTKVAGANYSWCVNPYNTSVASARCCADTVVSVCVMPAYPPRLALLTSVVFVGLR